MKGPEKIEKKKSFFIQMSHVYTQYKGRCGAVALNDFFMEIDCYT